MEKADYNYCPKCGTPFECKWEDILNCQCNTVSLPAETVRFLEKHYESCLCENCLSGIGEAVALAEKHDFPSQKEMFVEDVHYYIEGGYWVFTEAYHILRGTCCESGCRHCPYGFAVPRSVK